MGNRTNEELVSTVRLIVGADFSDMDIIRALHMAKGDPNAAINVIFDTPNFKTPEITKMPKSPCFNGKCNVARSASSSSDSSLGDERETVSSVGSEWWFVGSREVAAMSTCKGKKLNVGEEVIFTFPSKSSASLTSSGKLIARKRQAAAACSEIVRFSTKSSGEIGRIPTDWARCLLPLVRDKKVRIQGCCKFGSEKLGIMDTVLLWIR